MRHELECLHVKLNHAEFYFQVNPSPGSSTNEALLRIACKYSSKGEVLNPSPGEGGEWGKGSVPSLVLTRP